VKYPFIGVPVELEGPLAGKIVLIAYLAILVLLCGYGFHRYLMVYLYYRHKKKVAVPKTQWKELPPVTIQLPVYNELYVVERLIDATCKVEYPREKLEIQVLDDSTDETKEICQRKVAEWKAKGVDIVHIHRIDRTGYKAGALDNGMKTMKGRFVAVFDADFLPSADFLVRTIQHFTDDQVGMVQTRWGHLNRDYSMLTEVQSILLDGHFIMEHCARNRSGRFFNFSGTAGIWRREAIETAGGWQHDTLTEDLDLSFRSQLARWRFIFLPEIETPAELPVDMNGFKSQQYRWVKGSMQTSRKLLWTLMKADIPLKVKMEAFVHLTGNSAYFMMLILSVLMAPVMYFRTKMQIESSVSLDFGVFALATISVCFFYVCSQREIHGFKGAIKTVLYVPMLLSLGIGMCVSNTRAILEGLFSRDGGEFVRTPKYAIADRKQTFSGKKYKVALNILVPGVELALGLWFAAIIGYSIMGGMYFAIPFQALFMVGFLYVAFLSIFQGRLTAR
jgi:cellulose synthase/poly-beta-1,6-N-acetylglucosamine synthase-like glycosyltransferase